MGPSPCGSNTRFRHFCWIRIVAQCPDTWDRVHSVQIPDSDIFAGLELLHSVRTHGPESIWFNHPIPTFLLDQNCCTVSRHMGPSRFRSNTRFRHFCWIRNTWVRVHVAQIPDSDIFARLELLHSVRTHGPVSNSVKYPIPTFLLDENCCTVSGHMGPSPFSSNTRFRHFCWIRIVALCPGTWARVHVAQIADSDIFAG